MSSIKKRSGFSMWWVLLSFVTFILVELCLGGFIGQMLIGKYIAISLKLTIQSLLHLSSFFIGGVIIVIFSPGVRTWEPAIATFLSMIGARLGERVFGNRV
ncbi:hypothetical protein PVK62_00080 [Aliivibrio sp. S3MY1]|uniref:hypothetical protein n=1 Tax=unclassified Aliivibrio TaxID=2645654 RepID=UPI002379E7DE|nr:MULTISPECIES: hypothetical protein [unclassified Aliivibrio]MDD9194233.1 hypothetical protein [Aliivibrio sp. S3MY1]MDD9197900.1 hypothetical protein [Aliivibrio sp. S2MY1]